MVIIFTFYYTRLLRVMIIVIVLLALIMCGLGYCVYVLFDRTKPNKIDSVSFRESMDIVELPVLTLDNNGNKYKFIIDSGSNGCHIDKRIMDKLDVEDTKETGRSMVAVGSGLMEASKSTAQVKFSLNNCVFSIPFAVEDLSAAFDYIKKTDGMSIHGILGSNFLRANKWVLDFSEYVAYMKK